MVVLGVGAVSYERGTPAVGALTTHGKIYRVAPRILYSLITFHITCFTPSYATATLPHHGNTRLPFLASSLQGYLAHKKLSPPRTLQQAYLDPYGGPRGGGLFLMSEVPL